MKDTQFVPIPRLLWIMLQWTWEYCLSLRQWFHFLWLYIQKWDNGSHNSSLLNFLRSHHNIFQRQLYWYTFLSTVHEFSSVQSLSHVQLFVTPWIAASQTSLSITNCQSLLKLMPNESVMPSIHLILCHPLLLLPPIPPSIRDLSNESTNHIR